MGGVILGLAALVPMVRAVVPRVRPMTSKGHADLAASAPDAQLALAVPCNNENAGQGVRSLHELPVRLKTRTDDNHAARVQPSCEGVLSQDGQLDGSLG